MKPDAGGTKRLTTMNRWLFEMQVRASGDN